MRDQSPFVCDVCHAPLTGHLTLSQILVKAIPDVYKLKFRTYFLVNIKIINST